MRNGRRYYCCSITRYVIIRIIIIVVFISNDNLSFAKKRKLVKHVHSALFSNTYFSLPIISHHVTPLPVNFGDADRLDEFPSDLVALIFDSNNFIATKKLKQFEHPSDVTIKEDRANAIYTINTHWHHNCIQCAKCRYSCLSWIYFQQPITLQCQGITWNTNVF